MKKLLVFLAFLGVLMEQATTFNGSANFVNETMKDIVVYGSARLKDSSFTAVKVYGSTTCDTVKIKGKLNVSGSCNAEHLECQQLSISGSAHVKSIQVHGATEFFGSCSIDASEFNKSLNVDGSCTMANTTVYGKACIFGAAHFSDCTLNSLKIACKEAYFSHTTLKDIHVAAAESSLTLFGFKIKNDTHQTLYIEKGSVIEGDIVFEKGEGKIIVSGGSVIKGKVINGVIVQK